jgi:hypothetical protein
MNAWQPIETAPKNRWVLIKAEGETHPYVAQWAVMDNWRYGKHFEILDGQVIEVHETIKPTHWMPLPEPEKKND